MFEIKGHFEADCFLCSSLVPGRDCALEAVDLTFTGLGGEEISDKNEILGFTQVELAGLHVLELGMVDELLSDDLTSDKEDTLDLKTGLFTEHANLTERVLLEALKSGDETLKEVLEHVLNGSFLADLLVVEVPEGPSFAVNLGHHAFVTFGLLVGDIDEVGLEVVDIEVGGWELIKWVHDFLLLLCAGSRLRFVARSGSGWFSSRGL